MAEKKVKTRIQQKHDLEVNWLQATNFVPMAGEIIIYDKEVDADGNTLNLPEGRTSPYTYERFKIGDGHSTVNELPFTINAHNHICYGVCDTAANVADKIVTIDDFNLVIGAMVIVKFTKANSAVSPTLNVNGTGAKPIRLYGTVAAGTSSNQTSWNPGAVVILIYDGGGWLRNFWVNSTYTNSSLGHGYGTCLTESSAQLTATISAGYTLTNNGTVAIRFNHAVPAGATLNINNSMEKAIYYRGGPITANIVKAGDIATFIYNNIGSGAYHLLAIDRWQSDIDTLLANYNKVSQSSTSNNADYSVLLSNSIEDTTNTGIALKNHKLKYNPGTGALHIGELYNYDPDDGYMENNDLGSGTLTVNGDIIASGGDDGYGVMPARCNYGSIGLQENYWWNIYSKNVYADNFRKLDGTVPFASTDHTHTTVRSSNTSSKIFLVGTTTQSANATAYSHDTAYVGTDGHLYSNSSKVFSQTYAPEAYLTWGGNAISGGVGPIGAALSSEHSANRLAFLNPNALSLEYSTDAGATWTPATWSDQDKIQHVTTTSDIKIGGDVKPVTASHCTRMTIAAQDGTNCYVYTRPRKLLIYCNTSGHTLSVKIEYKNGVAGSSWNTLGTYNISGWSGWNDIDLSSIATFGGNKTQTTNYWYWRFTYDVTGVGIDYTETVPTIRGIRLFGDSCWQRTSNMGETGHLYSYDYAQNAIFPAKISATEFTGPLDGTANKAISDKNGNDIVDTYATKDELGGLNTNASQIQIFTWEADD